VALTHDTNGNMTALGPDTYSWNARNQLVGISGSSTASFQYDALGRRVGKTINGTATSFLHDGWQIVRETQGTEATGYLTGLALDEVYRRSTPTGSHDVLTDALGSILGLADSSQAITTSYTYEPYGGTTVQGAASTNPVQYTGRENDGTGLYYYRNRYYSPLLSRFVQSDPIGLQGGINTYAYVGSNPLSYVDPLGLAGVLPGVTPPPPGGTVVWPPGQSPQPVHPDFPGITFPPSRQPMFPGIQVPEPPPPQSPRGGGSEFCRKSFEKCMAAADQCGSAGLSATVRAGCFTWFLICNGLNDRTPGGNP
jgi:RHS repeat-associated protein